MPRAATRGVEVRVAPNMLRKAMHGDDDGLRLRRVCGEVGARVELRRAGARKPGFGVYCARHASVSVWCRFGWMVCGEDMEA